MADEILKLHEADIETFSIVPSDGGRFEFIVNDELLYSKLETRRHAEPGEISRLLENYLAK